MIPAQYVKPYVKTNKSDFIDAEAIAEAVGRPTMRFVPVKTDDQLDMQSLHRVRERWVIRRTAVVNQIRALLLERGITCRQGRRHIEAALPGMSGVKLMFRSTTTIIPDSCWNLFLSFSLSLLLIPVVVVAVVMWKSGNIDFQGLLGRMGKTVSPFFPGFAADRHFHGQRPPRSVGRVAFRHRVAILLGLFHSVAGDVQLHDDRVVHQPVDGCCRGHGVLEDSLPFREGKIAGQ